MITKSFDTKASSLFLSISLTRLYCYSRESINSGSVEVNIRAIANPEITMLMMGMANFGSPIKSPGRIAKVKIEIRYAMYII